MYIVANAVELALDGSLVVICNDFPPNCPVLLSPTVLAEVADEPPMMPEYKSAVAFA
jgi:hypothetical protein